MLLSPPTTFYYHHPLQSISVVMIWHQLKDLAVSNHPLSIAYHLDLLIIQLPSSSSSDLLVSKKGLASIIVIMFDELLSQMQEVLSDARQLKGPGKPSQCQGVALEGPFTDCTKPSGKVASFSKARRFKALEKEELKTTEVEWCRPLQWMGEEKKFSFARKERFQIQKPKYESTYINPDFNVVKKNTKNNVPIYRSPSKALNQSKVSVSTVDSETFRAPGYYHPNQEQRVKAGSFSKDHRFKQKKSTYHDTPLLINENQTKKRPPMPVVMKPKTTKTKQLISRQKQEELRERLKLVYWKNVPLELDRLFRNTSGPVIREEYFSLGNLKGSQKRSALLMMLDRLNYMRGGFEQDIATKMEGPCAVKYRKSTPKPFKFSEMEPGPEYYYPTDDYVRPEPIGFSFNREGLKAKPVQYDYRDYQIQEELTKKGGNIVINPEHQEHRLTTDELRSLERGPGFYDCLFKLVEKRTDAGVVAYREITAKNDRQNNCIEVKEVNDGIYFPSYQAMDPKVAAPVYKEPANIRPQHVPQKVLFPEHWLFYDGDLKKVRAQIAKNVILAKNMTFKKYKQYQQKFKKFQEYLQLQRKGPEAGEYQVEFTAVDPHPYQADFGKMEEKTLIDPIIKPEGDCDGDNLVLNPQQLQPHLPNIDFQKMEGRAVLEHDPHDDPKEGDRLVLSPKKVEKHIANVIFDKQEGRPENANNNEQPPEGDVLVINPKEVQPHLANIDFAKQASRPEVVMEKDEGGEENVLNIGAGEKRRVKGVPFARLSSVRMVPLLREKSRVRRGEGDEG